MPKRKREVDPNSKLAKPAFLSIPEQATEKDELLECVLEFSKHRKDTDEKLKALRMLLDYLEKRHFKSTSLTTNDVAMLTLPWSIKSVLGTGAMDESLIWRAMAVSLKSLTDSNDPMIQTLLQQQILNQSTLFKLCPKVALAQDPQATVAYDILTRDFFRPTLDVACKTLLIPLREAHGNLHSTLRLIRTLQLSRKGNPKTTFQLMASRPVLMALAQALDQAEEILSDALFHDQIDSYYSIFHKTALPSLDQPVTTKSKGFRCYQEEP